MLLEAFIEMVSNNYIHAKTSIETSQGHVSVWATPSIFNYIDIANTPSNHDEVAAAAAAAVAATAPAAALLLVLLAAAAKVKFASNTNNSNGSSSSSSGGGGGAGRTMQKTLDRACMHFGGSTRMHVVVPILKPCS